MIFPRFFVAALLSCPPLVAGESLPSKDQQEILRVQDARDVTRLSALLKSDVPAIRHQAALAAASVQDTTLIPELAGLLDDSSVETRCASALALGQLTPVVTDSQRAMVSRMLLRRLGLEMDEKALVRIVESIGKVGIPTALEQLISAGKERSGSVRAEMALTVGRFAYRNIKSPAAAGFAAKCLETGGKENWKAAYALMRIGVDSLLLPYLPIMRSSLDRGDADTRMFLAMALGATGSPEAVPILRKLADSDPDWRVRVNATRALGAIKSGGASVSDALLALSDDSNEHVSLTALAALRAVGKPDSLQSESLHDTLSALIDADPTVTSRQRGAAAVTLATLFRDGVSRQLQAWQTSGRLSEEDYVQALGQCDGDQPFETLVHLAQSEDSLVARTSLDALDAVVRRNPAQKERREQVRECLVSALDSEDMAVMVVAGSSLGDSLYADPSVVSALLERLSGLNSEEDAEPMTAMVQSLGALKSNEAVTALQSMLQDRDRTVALEAAKALESITSKSFVHEVSASDKPLHTDYDWEFLGNLSGAVVDVETSSGTFSFEMLPGSAPFTCVNFARLIDSGFYDGLRFHRVVSNFVIQGGDPRGDGWGGPGYTIRSEFGLEHYEAGMVGVASSGKDTEGCQFFVTHSKQPHLDGRYTIFGRITRGMEVVERIQVGDGIVKVGVVRRRNGERGTRNGERGTRNGE